MLYRWIFQFHFGTIDRNLAKFRKAPVKFDFNSTLVRLIETCFHSGWFDSKFQFHFGTIDRFGVDVPMVDTSAYFNSTLVRLIGTGKTVDEVNEINFNSTLVRLIVLSLTLSPFSLLFQFHFGTIDRSRISRGRIKNSINFNSTLVRLIGHYQNSCNRRSISISIPLWYD